MFIHRSILVNGGQYQLTYKVTKFSKINTVKKYRLLREGKENNASFPLGPENHPKGHIYSKS
jgi:hypothetical protein